MAALALIQLGQHRRNVGGELGQGSGRARVFHQLPDAVVDLAEVLVDGLAGVLRDAAHLDFQAHARQRRAQVV
ncbi:Uncharacterised protein [Bordetella pertussis]|nr:Uncharacterised protein [Bordetella pertussis]